MRREQSANVCSKKALPRSGSARCAVISLRSCPAEKSFPAAARTMTRTLASSRAAASSAWSASITAIDKTLAGGFWRVRRRIDPCRSTPTFAATSDCVEGIREIRDQIVGVLAADGNPHEVGRDVERLLALVGHRQMRHRRGRARQSLGTAEADREVGNLQRVEEGERLLLAALQIERKGRSGAGAVALENVRLARALLEKTEVADLLDLGVAAQKIADLLG